MQLYIAILTSTLWWNWLLHFSWKYQHSIIYKCKSQLISLLKIMRNFFDRDILWWVRLCHTILYSKVWVCFQKWGRVTMKKYKKKTFKSIEPLTNSASIRLELVNVFSIITKKKWCKLLYCKLLLQIPDTHYTHYKENFALLPYLWLRFSLSIFIGQYKL